MEPRYQELFRLEPDRHQDGCPVCLSAGALYKDGSTGNTLVQLKLQNLAVSSVVACTVEIQAFAVNGDPLEDVVHQYTDLSVSRGEFFGSKVPIDLPDPATRRIQVLVREVVLNPFRVWKSQDDALYPMPQSERLDNILGDARHIRCYSQRAGQNCIYVPKLEQGLFLCTCGRTNLAAEGLCGSCGATYEALSAALDTDAIHAQVEEELRQEEEARIAAEKAAEEARLERERIRAEKAAAARAQMEAAGKKTAKIAKIVVPVVAAIALIAALVIWVVIPAVEKNNAYNDAASLYDSGAYAAAESAFQAMGDYKDAPDRAKQSRYQIAERHLADGQFAQAIEVWESLGSYSDSADRAVQTLTDWKEDDYQKAQALKNEGAYIAAAEAFAALEDYKDAPQQRSECLALQQEADYQAALATLEAGEFYQAMQMFQALGDYQDSAMQYVTAAYGYGDSLFNQGAYADAAKYFGLAGDYEDAAERMTESYYQKAAELMKAEDYTAAVEQLGKCAGYKDADKLVLDAKHAYIKAHMSPSDKTTVKYMQDLLDAGYSNAKKLYNELYSWKVEVIAFNNDPGNSKTNLTSLSKYQYLCVHFKLTGGEPGKTTNIRTVLVLPNGQSGSIPHASVGDGYIGCSYGWYNDPARGATGTLTFKAYDENNKLLCTATVKVTN